MKLALLFSVLAVVALAEPRKITSGALKAYLIMPVTHTLTLDGMWVDIVACERDRCSRLVDRVRGSELKLRGGLRVFPDTRGNMNLGYKPSTEGEEVTIARSAYGTGWYPRAELCGGADLSTICRYELERDSETRSLSLKLVVLQ